MTDEEEKFDFLFKIMLVGESGVGKTCISDVLTGGVFKTNSYSTIAIDFKMITLKVKNKNVKL